MNQFSHLNGKYTKISTSAYNKKMLVISMFFAFSITGCSTLPKHKTEYLAQPTTTIDTSQTSLAQMVEPLKKKHGAP